MMIDDVSVDTEEQGVQIPCIRAQEGKPFVPLSFEEVEEIPPDVTAHSVVGLPREAL
jgi:hypothetical protein